MYLPIMQGIKYVLLFAIFVLSTAIGMAISKTYELDVKNKEFKMNDKSFIREDGRRLWWN